MAEDITYKDVMSEAKQAAAEERFDEAAKAYTKAIKLRPLLAESYQRLMILYRKKKAFQKELDIINTALLKFEQFYLSPPRKTKLSSALLGKTKTLAKKLGLVDRSGSHVFIPEPVITWRRRKQYVMKQLRKKRAAS